MYSLFFTLLYPLLILVAGIALGAFCWYKAKNISKTAQAENADTKINFSKRFIGYLFITIGVLMFVLCGGCTLIFLGFESYSELFEPQQGEDYVNIYTIGIVGGIPTATALIMYFVGRLLKKWGMK